MRNLGLTKDELTKAVITVLDGETYSSDSINKLLRKQFTEGHILDNIDRQILHLLSIGTKTKDLPNYLPLSIAGIEKRKRNLKSLFNIDKNGNKELIEIAQEKGFI